MREKIIANNITLNIYIHITTSTTVTIEIVQLSEILRIVRHIFIRKK